MNAFILAAGLGTRLKPWTLSHPKALVPVKGVPMLERVITSLREQGFGHIVVNVHHFASQIVDFLASRDFGVEIAISDESARLLDTGGALVRARGLFDFDRGPVLVHNVDILSNADLADLVRAHKESGNGATLLVSDRDSSRKLVFGADGSLRGWHNLAENRFRPEGFAPEACDRELAFSGIHVVGSEMFSELARFSDDECFPVMDYYLSRWRQCRVGMYEQAGLSLIDIGKPATLSQANSLF